MLDTATYDPHSPKKIGDIVGNTKVWAELEKSIAANSASHLVLVGPAGCGKTLFLRLALAEFPTLVIDCTANFGLRDVRESIRIFARGSRTVEGKLRWVIFEHADALTSDAQAFLRRMLETTSGSTRIVFECKDAGAISEPILSRSSIVSVVAPEETEIVYEVLRRTDFKLAREVAERIVAHNFGNVRSSMLHALGIHHCGAEEQDNIMKGYAHLEELVRRRPLGSPRTHAEEWIAWSCDVEQSCRVSGIDLRNVLRYGWPSSPIVAHTCQQWSRLGGTSPRALFMDCISRL